MAGKERGERAAILGSTPSGGYHDNVQVKVNYDLALKYLGGFGPWQRRVFVLACLPIAIIAFHLFVIVFLAVEPDFHCRVPQNSFSELNATPAELLNVTIPWGLKDGVWTRSQCKRYSYNLSDTTIYATYRDFLKAHPVANRTQIPCDDGYEYDTSEYKSTVVTEWNLVCDNSWKVNLAKSLWFAGYMFGAVSGGHAADRWGRRPVLLASLAVDYVSGIACAFSANYTFFVAIRFIIAASTTVSTLALFVMVQELVSADKRSVVGMVIWVPHALAYVLLPGIAYFIRTWMWLQIAITMPFLFFIPFWWTPNLRKWTVNIFFNWIVNTLVYYGISLNTAALSGNMYLNFAISGFVEIPAYILSIFILNRFGRRWPLCLMLLFGGVACIVAFFIPKHLGWMTTTLAMTGKFCITASFAVVYVFSAEIFPTVVRQIGIGMSSMSARVGGVVAPFINLLGVYWTPMPYVIFGGTSVAAGLLALLLPETKGKALPATIEDGENFGKEDGIVDEE
ncbi:organic cation transporter protein-like isoform X2 [Branchiostoma floridae x Branchiostoma japonicum]